MYEKSTYWACVWTWLTAIFIVLAAVGTAQGQVCVRVDEAHDSLSPEERQAALMLLARQFELAGEPVVANCSSPYTISHIRLGDVIAVTLSGPRGHREGTVQQLGYLPALYSQMVQSLVTGRSGRQSRGTVFSSAAPRVNPDLFPYFRLGYGSTFSGHHYGMPAVGFGYRRELDKFAIDVSTFNIQVGTSHNGSNTTVESAVSLLKLEGLYFVHSTAKGTPYLGAGTSWGSFDSHTRTKIGTSYNSVYLSSLSGVGLQGELTGGYEFGRATTLRMFFQADVSLPFYKLNSDASSWATQITTTRRYAPSFVVSMGVGWQKNRR